MPGENKCACMDHSGWSTHVGIMSAQFGRNLREYLDGSGTCETGVRDILVSIIVSSILAAEGEGGRISVDTILAEVKRRIIAS